MIRTLLFSAALAAAVGCGGAAEPGPQPLRHHLEDKHVAQVDMAEKQEMLAAQSAYNKAKAEKMKAEADFEDVKTKLELAKNEKKQAAISKDSASTKKESANDSGDNTRINAAMRDDRVAELGMRAAEQRVDTLEAKKSWLEKLIRYTDENTYAAEAKYELAKAKLARNHNISPPGFAMQAFADQYDERSKRAQKAKLISDQKRQKWQEEEKDYQAKKAESDHARGVDTATKGSK
ncbi:MAG TPA: hypothetical protein VMZ28_15595 [Kofleriaceae bacterium]|nr:hypothetical protein [Kofleriaceae bacterium]